MSSLYTPIRFYFFCGMPHQEITLSNGFISYRYKTLTGWKDWRVTKGSPKY